MILQSLNDYYWRLADEGRTVSEGFKNVEIPFLIVLSEQGEVVGLQDTRVQSGRRMIGRIFVVPEERARSGSKAWETANLLWDHYGYVLAWPKSDDEKAKDMASKQHRTFVGEVAKLRENYPDDKEISAVYLFLTKGDFSKVFTDAHWPECVRMPGCNLSFQINGATRLVCENENVLKYVTSSNNEEIDDEDEDVEPASIEGRCLVTGELGQIARLHPRTPIPGAKSNAKIVSFQKNMGFDSYGKLQSYNAPTSKKVAFAYTTALNRMLAKDSRQKFMLGDATTVFWAERKSHMEDVFADLFGEAAKGEAEQDYKQLIALFRSPDIGARVELDSSVKFHVLGLAPNAARIAIRFWYAGTVGEIADNIWFHFDDIEMIKGEKEWRRITLKGLLRSTAQQEEDKNLPPNLAGDFMRAILTGTLYPQTLLSSAIRRCRAEQDVTYPRAALIKAVLARKNRRNEQNTKEVSMSLDTNNTNPGYLLGRLFAVLERAQEQASPGINATIRDRFYGAASSTPVAVFAHLMKLKNHHIAKIDSKGAAVNLEKLIQEIVDKLGAADAFPAHLALDDQGRFAVGYYHQRQDFFKKKTDSHTKEA